MQCPRVRSVVLADIITNAPIVLCVGPSGLGYMCRAVSLPEFSVCTMPWLQQGTMHSRCSVSTEKKYRGMKGKNSSGARLAGPGSRLSLFLTV